MRHLIYLLVVANAVYFAWHLVESSSDDHTRRVAAALPSGVEMIETIRERQDRRLQAELEGVAEVEALIENAPPAAGRVTGLPDNRSVPYAECTGGRQKGATGVGHGRGGTQQSN